MNPQRYVTLDVIGSGGMATVWRARDSVLGRLVAIKRPNPTHDVSNQLFLREARAAASVAHPNLVAIYDTGTDDLGPYLVMELVEGPSLADATIPPHHVPRVGIQIASGLAALHQAGVVHGDVKPANVLLSPDGAKLTDFGVARAADDEEMLPRPGVTFGTPAYAAPEAMAHGERTPAGDVYSLAATLHELLTGSRWNDTVGATQAMPPAGWARILTPALAANPADRPTAGELAARLEVLDASDDDGATSTVPMLAASGGEASTVPGADGSSTRRLAIGAVLGGALVVVALVLATRDRSITSADRLQVTPTSAATESVAPSPTDATTQPTSVPPTSASATAPTPMPPPTRTVSAIVTDLEALIEAVPPDELKRKDAADLVKRVDEVVRAAEREPREAEKKLREAAEKIAEDVEDDTTLEAAEQLLVELGEMLRIPSGVVTDAFERRD